MVSKIQVAFLAVIAFAICNTVNGDVKCYVCTSSETAACGTDFKDSANSATCGSGEGCGKIVSGNDNSTIERKCTTETACKTTTDPPCYYCAEDNCNSGYTFSVSLGVLALSAVAIKLNLF